MFLLFTFFIGSSGFSIMKVLLDMLRHYIFLLIHWSPGWLYSPPGWAEWPLTPHMHSPQFYRDPAPHNTLGYSRGQRKQIQVKCLVVFGFLCCIWTFTWNLNSHPKSKSEKMWRDSFYYFSYLPNPKIELLDLRVPFCVAAPVWQREPYSSWVTSSPEQTFTPLTAFIDQ